MFLIISRTRTLVSQSGSSDDLEPAWPLRAGSIGDCVSVCFFVSSSYRAGSTFDNDGERTPSLSIFGRESGDELRALCSIPEGYLRESLSNVDVKDALL